MACGVLILSRIAAFIICLITLVAFISSSEQLVIGDALILHGVLVRVL